MLKQNMLNVTPLVIVSGLLLGGCAHKQVWSPALEDAQNTFQEISADPVVSSLASNEINAALQQLNKAETAAAEFRTPHSIDHEARLAKIKTLVAQQRARALSANHSLQVALGQPPLLAEEQILAATAPPPVDTPTMAAAIPMESIPGSQQDLVAQLALVTAQLAELQARIDGPAMVSEATANVSAYQIPAAAPPPPAAIEEPLLGAAMSSSSLDELKPLPSPDQVRQQLRAINAKPTGQGMALTLGERYFENGSARLWSNRASRHLDNVASILTSNPALKLDIESHTDNSADADASYNLSFNRAVSLKSALVLRGIEESRISANGYGDTRPVTENSSPLGRLQNRRIDLVFPNVNL